MAELFDAERAAQLLSVRPATVRGWALDGRLPPGRMVGRKLYWSRGELNAARDSARPAVGVVHRVVDAPPVVPELGDDAVLGAKAAVLAVRAQPGPWVYFIALGPYCKIGTTRDVLGRLSALSLSERNLLAVVPGSFDDKRAFHRRFAPLRAHKDWFYLRDELAVYLLGLQRELLASVPVAAGVSGF